MLHPTISTGPQSETFILLFTSSKDNLVHNQANSLFHAFTQWHFQGDSVGHLSHIFRYCFTPSAVLTGGSESLGKTLPSPPAAPQKNNLPARLKH